MPLAAACGDVARFSRPAYVQMLLEKHIVFDDVVHCLVSSFIYSKSSQLMKSSFALFSFSGKWRSILRPPWSITPKYFTPCWNLKLSLAMSITATIVAAPCSSSFLRLFQRIRITKSSAYDMGCLSCLSCLRRPFQNLGPRPSWASSFGLSLHSMTVIFHHDDTPCQKFPNYKYRLRRQSLCVNSAMRPGCHEDQHLQSLL